MKKEYEKPTMQIVNMKYQGILASSSTSGGFNAPEYPGFYNDEIVIIEE